jgi:type VI secretion system protein ImpL
MAYQWDQLKYYLGIPFLLSFYGIVSLIVYYGGATLGIPLSFTIVVIALILLTWPIAILINHFRKKRKRKKEAAADGAAVPSQAGQAPAGSAAPTRSYVELNRGAEEAVQWLGNTKLGGSQGGNALYSLPWFLVAGPFTAGKTSLLLTAGLDFHALPSQRRADQNLIRPTRDCEWRVTDSAVMMDTAGRYQYDGPDRDEWAALVETIKKHRKKRPIDGLVIATDASRVVSSSDTEIEQEAKTLRARLDDVIGRTKTRFPLYVVFTHADSIEGFGYFFRTFSPSERCQVWGATIPLEQSANAHALFDVEFDYLYDALIRRRLVRLGDPASSEEQLRVFDFPLRFNAARRKLGVFTSALTRPNPFSENPLLRGFYFTSSTANGNPPRSVRPAGVALAEDVPEVQEAGEGFFTRDFFGEVLLRDKDLAASFQMSQKSPHRWRNILLAVGAVLLFILALGMLVSFVANQKLLAAATERAARVDEITRSDAGKDPLKKDSTAARVEVENADALRETLAVLDDYDRNSPPLYLRFGLYSGNGVNRELRNIYFESITQRYFKPAVAALERDLHAFAGASGSGNAAAASGSSGGQAGAATDDLGRYYDLLKAYLMTSEPNRAESSFLANTLRDYWKKASPPDMETVSQQQLEFYSKQAMRDDAPHYKPDGKLVTDARGKLGSYPAVARFYKGLTTDIASKVDPITLDKVLAGKGGGVLSGSYAVPGSFTLEGYHGHVVDAIASANEEIGKDDWVMGSGAPVSKDQKDVGRLQTMYLRDYTSQWQKFLKDVSVRRYNNRDEAIAALKVLSAPDSPMVLLMAEVARQTNISQKPKSGGIFGWIKNLFSSSSSTAIPSNDVEKEYHPLIQFAGTEDQKDSSQLSQYRATLSRVLKSLEGTSADQLNQASKALLTGKDDLGLQQAETEISGMVDSFKTAETADAAALLKQPLSNLRDMLYGGGYAQIEKAWREQIYPAAHKLESGFPFADGGSTPVSDLARFFNPVSGQFTLFFNDKLQSSFEESQGRWKLKEQGAIKFSDGFVNYLSNARQLRDALFPNGGQQPEVGYEILLQPVPGADVRVEIDGNPPLEIRGATPSSGKFTWPSRSGQSGIKITVIRSGAEPEEKAITGEWGLFQMIFGAGSRAGDKYQLAWTVGSSSVRATLTPSSATNPFNRQVFSQVRAPQGTRE